MVSMVLMVWQGKFLVGVFFFFQCGLVSLFPLSISLPWIVENEKEETILVCCCHKIIRW